MLPTDRHFDCMKKCPMDCGKVCKRLVYPRLVSALLELTYHRDAEKEANAERLLRDIGETN